MWHLWQFHADFDWKERALRVLQVFEKAQVQREPLLKPNSPQGKSSPSKPLVLRYLPFEQPCAERCLPYPVRNENTIHEMDNNTC